MIKEGNVSLLNQNIKVLEDSFNKLREAYAKKDSDNFNKLKKNIVQTQKRIFELIK